MQYKLGLGVCNSQMRLIRKQGNLFNRRSGSFPTSDRGMEKWAAEPHAGSPEGRLRGYDSPNDCIIVNRDRLCMETMQTMQTMLGVCRLQHV